MKRTILVSVYNTIEHDGRVRRAAEAASECADVCVLALDSGTPYSNKHFLVERVASSKMPIIGKLFSHPLFWIYFIRMARRLRPDVIHAHDFFMAMAGWLAARLSGARLIYDAHELYIPEPDKHLSARDYFWYLLERWTVSRADAVIAANEERGRLMKVHYNLRELPIIIKNIPPAPKPATYEKVEKVLALFPSVHRTGNDLCLLVYQGDVNIDRGVERFIKAVEGMPCGYRLIVIGGGPDLNDLRTRYSVQENEGKISFLGKVSGDQLPILLRACDVGVVTYPFQGLNNIYCASNKIFEYAHSGLSIIATDQPPLVDILVEYGIGESVTREDTPEQIAKTIIQISRNLAIYRDRLPRFLEDNPWTNEADRLQRLYKHLLKKA